MCLCAASSASTRKQLRRVTHHEPGAASPADAMWLHTWAHDTSTCNTNGTLSDKALLLPTSPCVVVVHPHPVAVHQPLSLLGRRQPDRPGGGARNTTLQCGPAHTARPGNMRMHTQLRFVMGASVAPHKPAAACSCAGAAVSCKDLHIPLIRPLSKYPARLRGVHATCGTLECEL